MRASTDSQQLRGVSTVTTDNAIDSDTVRSLLRAPHGAGHCLPRCRVGALKLCGCLAEAMQRSGHGYAAGDVHAYLEAKIRGRAARRPKPLRWRRAAGYLALYRHDVPQDVVRVLRIRHQREAGYKD